jgi:heme/copper-type cytochrome/quinol oxidase subunit 2
MTFAAVRPDEWNFPLLVHVLSAMVFVGVLAAVVVLLVASRRGDSPAPALRLAFSTLLIGAIPSYIVMRGSAEWIASEEDVPDDAAWVNIGYMVTDVGLLVLLAVTLLLGLAKRRLRRGEREPGGLVRPATVLTLLIIAAYAVALWAMTAKPV